MTGYNADENLILYSVVVRERTREGVPDIPDLTLVNTSVLEWTVPNHNGRNITGYTVTVDSSGAINMATVSNKMTSFDLAMLKFPSGFQSNVTVQAINDVGASNQSNPVTYNTSLGDLSTDNFAIIGGAAGGATLLAVILLFLCVVIKYMRRSYRIKLVRLKTNNTTKDVTSIKLTDLNIPIATNANEHDYDYVQFNEFSQHTGLEKNNMNIKASHRGSTEADRTTPFDKNFDVDFYCSSDSRSSHNDTANAHAYTHCDHLLRHNATISTIRDTREHQRKKDIKLANLSCNPKGGKHDVINKLPF